MNFLKVLGLTIVHLATQAGALLRALGDSFRPKPAVTTAAQLEAERLDRIRNPSKYIGR